MMKYRDVFLQQHNFLRSTRLDLDKADSSTNFVATPLFAHVLDRVITGLCSNGPRAISVTGPFGTGKSTTIFKLLQLLESGDDKQFKELGRAYPELEPISSLPQIIPIPVYGTSSAIAPNIKAAISRIAESLNDLELMNETEKVDSSDLNAIIKLIEIVRTKHPSKHLILVIDELGKHLEYAASHPEDNDVYLLQLIAEYADRSTIPKMTVITILHQAFENYGNRLLRTQREEFAKIQGRFEDIAFQLPVEDTLKIMGASISSTCMNSDAIESVRNLAERIGQELFNLGAVPINLSQVDYISLCRECAPLHPLTALLIGPLFRHFAQNERSLFSMLGSNEPCGFQRFLNETEINTEAPKLYGLSELYEYIATSLGSSIYHSSFSRRWSIIETALGRVPDNNDSTHNLVKSIGLISAIPIRQLVASKYVLELSQGTQIDESIQLLTNRSIVVHRRYSNSYRLWDGSDIDIESLIEDARRSIGVPSFIESLARLVPLRPITARKHSMQTGALRWFDMTYITAEQIHLIKADSKPLNGDGRVYVVISSIDERLPSEIDNLEPWQMVLWTVLPPTLFEAVTELYYVRWVKENTPALRDDEVARREITEREYDLEHLIERTVDGAILRPEGVVTVFTHSGAPLKLEGKQLNSLVSELCDRLYPKAPRVINEFVNRNVLSTAATAARNDVLKRIITNTNEKDLGIIGSPPQLPIYLSTLQKTGLHREVEGKWELYAPGRESTWFDSWSYLESKTKETYCPVSDLWSGLSLPPYGVRRGLLPLLTVAYMYVNRNRVSIMENDAFVPELSTAVIERLLRNPEQYKIRLSEISGNNKAFIEIMVQQGALSEFDGTTDLLSLVRPLIAFANRLPEYTRNTKLLSEKTIKLRQALLTAKEPAELLFYSLPSAVGFESIDTINRSSLPEIVTQIVDSIRELADCYPKLLSQIQAIIFETFGYYDTPTDAALDKVRKRATIIQNLIRDLDFKAVVWRMTQDTETDKWLDSVASVIMKKTPKNWFDRTLDEFKIEIALSERKFVHYETIASLYKSESSDIEPVRIGITTLDTDFETVISLSEIEHEQTRGIVHSVINQFNSGTIDGNQLLLIASELVKAYYSDSQKKGKAEQHA